MAVHRANRPSPFSWPLSLFLFVYCLIVPPGNVCLALSLFIGPPCLDEGQDSLYIMLPEIVKPWHNTKFRSWFAVDNPLLELSVGMVPSMPHFVMRMRPANTPFAVAVTMAGPAGCGVHFSSPGKRQ